MAIAEFTIIPIGTATTSLSSYVADLHKELEKHADITFQMTPMGTILEGSLDRILAVIRAVHEVPFANGAERVSTSIKIDDRRDKPASMQQKMQSVADKLK
ncbi:MTH1187 family thiamine-binding protein [Paenibacillus sp. HWE-109]|uniref:MTH1187 family thiamine-binding protein n=1 Tax=Paenibacillus sp. HWE-109 TaxID=1306526 RepID=UPI001EDE408A|nr:MTH1187 family thiamine-binding protein [Paenibacillus sp. HWE-109]UKS26261.1 MTH1187 family thiamine-binding protein [Paenibacillus sp. HWE-109]